MSLFEKRSERTARASIGALFVTFTAAFAVSLSSAHAANVMRFGPGSTGGGNLTPPKPVSVDHVNSAIFDFLSSSYDTDDAQTVPRFFIDFKAQFEKAAYHKAVYELYESQPWWENPDFLAQQIQKEPEKMRTLVAKLFPDNGAKTVLDVFHASSKPIKSMSKVCRDKLGRAMDASAFTTGEKQICFSIPRLVRKLNMENYRDQIAALTIHEVSHGVNTTEEEAEFLQRYFLQEYQFRTRTKTFYKKQLISVVRDLNELIRRIDAGRPIAGICNSITQQAASGVLVHGIPNDESFNGAPVKVQSELMAAWAKINVLKTACLENDEDAQMLFAFIFQGERELPLAHYLVRLYGFETVNPMVGWYPPPPTPFGEKIKALDIGSLSQIRASAVELVSRLSNAEKEMKYLSF